MALGAATARAAVWRGGGRGGGRKVARGARACCGCSGAVAGACALAPRHRVAVAGGLRAALPRRVSVGAGGLCAAAARPQQEQQQRAPLPPQRAHVANSGPAARGGQQPRGQHVGVIPLQWHRRRQRLRPQLSPPAPRAALFEISGGGVRVFSGRRRRALSQQRRRYARVVSKPLARGQAAAPPICHCGIGGCSGVRVLIVLVFHWLCRLLVISLVVSLVRALSVYSATTRLLEALGSCSAVFHEGLLAQPVAPRLVRCAVRARAQGPRRVPATAEQPTVRAAHLTAARGTRGVAAAAVAAAAAAAASAAAREAPTQALAAARCFCNSHGRSGKDCDGDAGP